MKTFSWEYIKKRFAFFTSKPQIVYTTFLLIAIPVAFLFSSQMFLDISRQQQGELEKDGIALMLDTLSKFSLAYLDDGMHLQEKIEAIGAQNQTIVGFDILKREAIEGNVQFRTIAALDGKGIGEFEPDTALVEYYNIVAFEAPYFKTETHADGRHQIVAYPILNTNRNVAGVIALDLSMAEQDAIFASNILKAYGILAIIILLIGVLLVRQAKVIDYAVLYKRLKDVDQMKDDFISMAAHELRTPLTIIRGYTEMLSGSKRLSENDRTMTQNIDGSARHLNQLINDILDVSRLQQGRLSFKMQPLNPQELIDETVESLVYTAEQKDLKLGYKPKDSGIISVDSDRLKQVLVNIIGNAVKYTLQGSVTVTSYIEYEKYIIRVSDTGIGISAEAQQKLFSRFYRVKTQETEKIRGTGLGLWITKKIVNEMNGTISVESIRGKGTDFVLSFSLFKEKQ